MRTSSVCLLLLPLLVGCAAAHETTPQAYVSCRCCCSESGHDLPVICLYHGQGDSLEDIIRKDDEWRHSPVGTCQPDAGCTQSTLYRYCDETPPALE